jgi:hypothetical protein
MVGQILCLLLLAQATSLTEAARPSTFNEALRRELLAVVKTDQEVRGVLNRAGFDRPPPPLVAKLEGI